MPGSIRDVLPAACAVLGVPGAPDRLGLAQRHGDARHVLLVLVDGLGLHLLPRLAPHAPLLASVLAGGTGRLDELACTFPSTTPTSLVSLTTGTDPGAHGVVGFTVAVPGTERVLTHITWRDEPDPARWQPQPTWFQRAAATGVPCTALLPAAFAGSGLTDAAYRGARFEGVGPDEDLVARALALAGGGPGLTYAYTAALDTAAHLHGIASPQWAAAAAGVDRLLSALAGALPPDALLLVTADHGGLDVPPGARIDVCADPELMAGVRVIAGEPRARYVHTDDGAAGDVAAAWRARLAGRADVLTRDEAVAAGLFGPVSPEHAARIGDVVAICTGDTALLAGGREPAAVARLIGFHGARTAAETAIPLISLRA